MRQKPIQFRKSLNKVLVLLLAVSLFSSTRIEGAQAQGIESDDSANNTTSPIATTAINDPDGNSLSVAAQTDDPDSPIADWTVSGSCQWGIDANGCLTIKPRNGNNSGQLAQWTSEGAPWRDYSSKILKVRVEGVVKAPDSLWKMFYSCNNLTSVDLSGFDCSEITNTAYMFKGCSSLESLNIPNLVTSKVTRTYDMFSGCSSLTSLDVSGWKTSGVYNMNSMFNGCSSLTSLDVSGWNTSSAQNIASMFNGCSSLTSLDVSEWNTSRAETAIRMFSGCSSLTSLDVSKWDTSNVSYMYDMFRVDFHC